MAEFPTGDMIASSLTLDVGMGRVHAWGELTNDDGYTDEEAAWIIQHLDWKLRASAVWQTGECPADGIHWSDDDPRSPARAYAV